MKQATISKSALLCAALIAFATPCAATETPATTGHYNQKIQQEEAFVVRIDQNNVTLQSASDKSRILTIVSSNAADFKVGEKVTVMGDTLKKFENTPNSAVKPEDSSSSTTKPASENML